MALLRPASAGQRAPGTTSSSRTVRSSIRARASRTSCGRSVRRQQAAQQRLQTARHPVVPARAAGAAARPRAKSVQRPLRRGHRAPGQRRGPLRVHAARPGPAPAAAASGPRPAGSASYTSRKARTSSGRRPGAGVTGSSARGGGLAVGGFGARGVRGWDGGSKRCRRVARRCRGLAELPGASDRDVPGRAASQAATSRSAAGWPALLDQVVRAARVAGDAGVADRAGQQVDGAARVSRPPSVQGRTSGTPDSGPAEVATTRLSGASRQQRRHLVGAATSSRTSSSRRPAAAPRTRRPGRA